MTAPMPLIFTPLFKPRAWGGRKLATLYDKPLPPDTAIGESWEISDIPGHETLVRDGPLAGVSLQGVIADWGPALLGDAPLRNGRFPLLIKLLDARDALSVQVHPRAGSPGAKNEAWYVLHAQPGARIYAGLRAGAGQEQFAQAAGTREIVRLLETVPADPGTCIYLPSGTIHALGEGLVILEVQDPEDVTYRVYDWERVGPTGRTRELHVAESLKHGDAAARPIVCRLAEPAAAGPPGATHCGPFWFQRRRIGPGGVALADSRTFEVWFAVSGSMSFRARHATCMRAGETALIPARAAGWSVESERGAEIVAVGLSESDG